MASASVHCYRNLLITERNRLSELCCKWRENLRNENILIPEEIQGHIRTAVGQAELLMNQRFTQFKGLVDNCEFSLGEKKTTCEDLAGFWDMIYFQVEDVDKKFQALSNAELNNWVFEEEVQNQSKPRIRVLKPVNATNKPRDKVKYLEAKKRLAEAKALKVINESIEKENQKTFEMPGFFVVSSPLKKKPEESAGTPTKGTPKRTPIPSNKKTPTSSMLIAHVTRSARKALATQLQYD